MTRRLPCVAVLAAVALAASSAEAQTKRFELIPTAGYTWGGSRDFDAQIGVPVPGGGTINVPGGEFFLEDSFSWGLTAAWEGSRGSFFTITYQRQDTKLGIRFDVQVVSGANTTELHNQTIDSAGAWHDSNYDLGRWAGQDVALRLTVDGEVGSVGLWSSPVIYGRPAQPVRVVILLEDALRADHLSVYGYDKPT